MNQSSALYLRKNLLYKGFKPIMNSKGEEKTENLGQQWSEKSIFFFLKVSADLLLYLRSPTTTSD